MNESVRIEIERYLAGGMSPEEGAAFLETLRDDREALGWLGRALEDQAHLHDVVRSLPTRMPGRVVKVRRFRMGRDSSPGAVAAWIGGGIAAAALLILVAAAAFSGRPEPSAPERIAREEPPAPIPSVPEPPPVPRIDPPAPLPPPVPPPSVKPAPPPPPPLPPPEPRPPVLPPPAPAIPRPSEKPTVAAIALFDQIQGEVMIHDEGQRRAVRPGEGMPPGAGITTGKGGLAALRFSDGTRVEFGPLTKVDRVLQEKGKAVFLAEGSFLAQVSPQPSGAPMVFMTRHSELTVIGTRLAVQCAAESTRLEVREGRVRMTRLSDRSAVEVRTGHFAVAGPGAEPVARPFPIDEILIHPEQGVAAGSDWRVVRDAGAAGGTAIESLRSRPPDSKRDDPRITFRVKADAEREYFVWVRGCALATDRQIERDAVILDFGDALVLERPGPNKGKAGGPPRALFNGYMHQPGFWWLGGDADGKKDDPPVVVRFVRPGEQTILLHAYESPVRIDAIWLSTTQKTRPAPGHFGPAPK